MRASRLSRRHSTHLIWGRLLECALESYHIWMPSRRRRSCCLPGSGKTNLHQSDEVLRNGEHPTVSFGRRQSRCLPSPARQDSTAVEGPVLALLMFMNTHSCTLKPTARSSRFMRFQSQGCAEEATAALKNMRFLGDPTTILPCGEIKHIPLPPKVQYLQGTQSTH